MGNDSVSLGRVLLDNKLVVSMAEGRRLISSGVVSVNESKAIHLSMFVEKGQIVKVGHKIEVVVK